MVGPRLGDAYGELLRAALAEESAGPARSAIAMRDPVGVQEIVERDDGFISAAPAARYLAPPRDWPRGDRLAMATCRGRVLDVGAGAGRFALALQERGVEVTALDVSPGAVEVCRARGVRSVAYSSVAEHRGEYDTFLLWGNNLGLLGGAQAAPLFLAALGALAAPGARIVAQGTDPYATADPGHLAYQAGNRRRGRLPGQLRLRVRFRTLATGWFDYLLCSADELSGLVAGARTGWRLKRVKGTEAGRYTAILAWGP